MNVGMSKRELSKTMTVSLQLLVHGKEVGSIIGRRGESIKRIREESGAWIKISDGNLTERTITLTGTNDAIFKAFTMIITKLEGDIIKNVAYSTDAINPLVNVRLVVPSTQLSSLIGEDGTRIKKIHESSGAQVLVSKDMLPNTSQRAVTISGLPHCVSECIKQICQAMLELLSQSLERSYTTPSYQHELASSPLSDKSGSHYLKCPPPLSANLGQIPMSPDDVTKLNQQSHSAMMYSNQFSKTDSRSSEMNSCQAGFQTPLLSTHEFAIPNYLIGTIIGHQGANINEIRRVSGAMIKIASPMEGCSSRLITITGFPSSIHLARFLISLRLSSWRGRDDI